MLDANEIVIEDKSSGTQAVELGCSSDVHPAVRKNVARADAQRFEDVRLGLLVAAGKILPHTDRCVGVGEMLMRVLAYRLQSDAFGDLDKSIQRIFALGKRMASALVSTAARLRPETAST